MTRSMVQRFKTAESKAESQLNPHVGGDVWWCVEDDVGAHVFSAVRQDVMESIRQWLWSRAGWRYEEE